MQLHRQKIISYITGSPLQAIRAGSEIPRTEIKILLPAAYYSVGAALEGMAQRKVEKAYEKLGRRLPPHLSVPELMIAKKMAESPAIANPEFFRAHSVTGKEFDVVCAEFYKRSVFLEWYHINDVHRFFSQSETTEMEISVGGKRFTIKKDGEYVSAEISVRNTIQSSLSGAISIIHFRDMLQTCSPRAAAKYADGSHTLRSPKMRELLQPMLDYICKEGEHPKMALLGLLLSERQGQRCLVVCETHQQADAIMEKFPFVQATNHPKEKSMAGFEAIILYNPSNHSVEAAWKSGACEILAMVAKGTVDEERYWQKSKQEDARKKPGNGLQLLLF